MLSIFFWSLSAITIIAALCVVFSKSPIYSILWLVVVFFSLSGHYILLNAQFIAIVNLIVYAGAIMVLFLFVVMLMNLNRNNEPFKSTWLKLIAITAAGVLFLVLIDILANSPEMKQRRVLMLEGNIGLVKQLGKVLFTDYAVPFQVSSVLFLSAMIGAITLGKKEETTTNDSPQEP